MCCLLLLPASRPAISQETIYVMSPLCARPGRLCAKSAMSSVLQGAQKQKCSKLVLLSCRKAPIQAETQTQELTCVLKYASQNARPQPMQGFLAQKPRLPQYWHILLPPTPSTPCSLLQCNLCKNQHEYRSTGTTDTEGGGGRSKVTNIKKTITTIGNKRKVQCRVIGSLPRESEVLRQRERQT